MRITKGDTVRLRRGKRTATVLADSLTFGSETIHGALFLDRPLGGLRYWNEADVVRVAEHRQKGAQE